MFEHRRNTEVVTNDFDGKGYMRGCLQAVNIVVLLTWLGPSLKV